MQVIRAKFRCLSIETRWDGSVTVTLGPVKRAGKDVENSFFWKYTPSGEIQLGFQKGAVRHRDQGEVVTRNETSFSAGSYYYVDMQRAKEADGPSAPWRISSINQTDGNVDVGFYCTGDEDLGCKWSNMRLGLSSEAEGARVELQPHGSRWNVNFTFAEASDG